MGDTAAPHALAMTRQDRKTIVKLIREGDLLAEVDVTLLYDIDAWAPHMDLGDVRKLERVRTALAEHDLERASKDARLFDLRAHATG